MDALVGGVRRSLVYPYIRFLDFSIILLKDVARLCSTRRNVITAFLALRELFEKSDTLYLLNKLYIDQYLHWVGEMEEGVLSTFGGEVKSAIDGLSREKVSDKVGLGIKEAEEEVERECFGDDNDDGESKEEEEEEEEEEEDYDGGGVEEGTVKKLIEVVA